MKHKPIIMAGLATALLLLAAARTVLGAPLFQAPQPVWTVWEMESGAQSLAADGGSSVWGGLYKQGLAQWTSSEGPLALYTEASGLAGDDVMALTAESDGSLWVVSLDGGVSYVPAGGGEIVTYTPDNSGLPNKRVRDVVVDRANHKWFATLGGGVARLSADNSTWSVYDMATSGLPHDDVYALAVDGTGNIWVGTMGYGAAMLSTDQSEWITYTTDNSALTDNNITDIAVDATGAKWFATDGGGVSMLSADNTTWTVYTSESSALTEDFVQTITLDSAGNKWFGTLGGGASKLSADGTAWASYTTANSPIPEDDILAISEDEDGSMWFATYNAGVARLGLPPDPLPTYEIIPFGRPDYIAGDDVGYFLWLDQADYRWHLSWTSEGAYRTFQGTLTADGAITSHEAAGFEIGSDSVTVSGNTLSFGAQETSGEDEIIFELARSVTQITIHLQRDNVYYPLTISIGSESAHPGFAPFVLPVPQPQPPVVTLGENVTTEEGAFLPLSGDFVDEDSPSGHTISWDLGDGTTISDELYIDHTYADNGVYTVTLTVTDVHGTVGTDTQTVTVTNVVPDVYFFGPDATIIDEEVIFEGSFSDVSPTDTHTTSWNFGDGSTQAGTLTATHSYLSQGPHTVRLTVTDDDGGVGIWESTITVAPSEILIVNSTGDEADSSTADGACRNVTGACTLRAAIEQANATVGVNTLIFNLPGSAPYIIQPASALPAITDPLVIDGTTQPGYAGTPIVRIDGVNAGTGNVDGLVIRPGGSTVRGLQIVRFASDGISLENAGGNTISDCFIGTDGAASLGNGMGIRVMNSPNNVIGGVEPGAGNVLSGNNTNGLYILGSSGGNQVLGNRIGTDSTGTLDLGNANVGIYVDSVAGTVIGGTAPGAGNLISGNNVNGIHLGGAATSGTIIRGNRIGTNAAGTAALANTGSGIYIDNAPNNTIGGTGEEACNLIAGNGNGIVIANSGANGNLVQGNRIGTDVTGTLALGNTTDGITIKNGASNNTIGGTAAGAGNLISGNGSSATYTGANISIFSAATGNLVQSNRIGTNAGGTAKLGSSARGVRINAAAGNTVGGTAAGAGNLISGGNAIGILIDGVAGGNLVQGNTIGFDTSGTLALGNTQHGIKIDTGSNNNVIGGIETGAGNLIGNNTWSGINIRSGSSGNTLRGNRIDGNVQMGIDLFTGSSGVTLNDTGDADTGANNLQNFPVLTSANTSAGSTTVAGSLNSSTSTAFTLDFYASPACESTYAPGYGEGATYLGAGQVTTDASGNASFSINMAEAATSGWAITATATDLTGNTSEFSGCMTVTSTLGTTLPEIPMAIAGAWTWIWALWPKEPIDAVDS